MSQPTNPLLPGLPVLLAELQAAAEKRQTTPTSEPLGFAPTLAQLEERDFRSLVAGGWLFV